MYENALLAAAADLAASDHLENPADWHTFVSHSGLMTRYPGVEVMSIVRPVPHAQLDNFIADERRKGSPDFNIHAMFGAPPPAEPAAPPPGEHFLIVCAEPPAVAARALGSDMTTDPVRRATAERARDSGAPAFSPNAHLGNNPGLGLQLFIPVYSATSTLATVQQRRSALIAWVIAVFAADTFFHSAMGGQEKFIELQVFDQAAAPANRLFSSALAAPEGRPFERSTTLDLDGTRWILGWNPARGFPFTSRIPAACTAGFSALITFLVAALMFRLQSTARLTQTRLDNEQERAEGTRAFLASLVQSSDDSIVGTTLDGEILSWNVGSERLWGYTAKEAIGQHITMFFLPEHEPDFRAA